MANEDLKNKIKNKNWWRRFWLTSAVGLPSACALLFILSSIDSPYLEAKRKEESRQRFVGIPGLIYVADNKREYIFKPTYYPRGIEQIVYIDKKPFGSLDAVKSRVYISDTGFMYETEERKPAEKEIGRFEVLEEYSRRDHFLFLRDD